MIINKFDYLTNDIYKLLQEGTISCVLNQDWAVNRIAPDFLNKDAFKSTLIDGQNILHLGIGNGECYKFFCGNKNCHQASISDRLYFDPIDIISFYLKKCCVPTKVIPDLAKIMRDEYLISISYDKLYFSNKNFFNEKDVYLSELLINEFCKKNSYSYSYNVLLLLIYLLNKYPILLLPNMSMLRYVTQLGKHIIGQKTNEWFLQYNNLLNNSISMEDVTNIILKQFSDIKHIYLSDFRNVTLTDNIQYDYILATRSDAFLMNEYAQFVQHILKYMKKDGVYISDGVLCSYSYQLFYNELIMLIQMLGEKKVFFVKSNRVQQTLPIQYISGIIIVGENTDIERVYPFISPKRLVSAQNIFRNTLFIKQCIWSDLFAWASSKNIDLEIYSFKKINSIINKYINLKKNNICLVPIFDDEKLIYQI